MKNKQQDYIVKTSFNAAGNLKGLTWKNASGQIEAPADFPSEVTFNSDGLPRHARWTQCGKDHRDGDRPAHIWFDSEGRPRMWGWWQDGKSHRDGGKPAVIGYVDGSLKSLQKLLFSVDGKARRIGGGETDFEFSQDGTARNPKLEVVHFEGFDKRWLPSPVPTLLVPQPMLLRAPAIEP